MIPLEWVVLVAWNKECGQKLRELRGKTSRREIAEGIVKQGVECSQEYVRKLESGDASAVSTSILIALCKTLDADPSAIIPIIDANVPKIFCTPT
jgi:DNA-binding Xre family transcriptional regulator